MPFSTALPSCNPLFSNALHPASTRRRWDLRTVGTGIASDSYIVAYSLATTGLRVITPTGGWWSIGVPDGITPVWFAVATGQIVAIGVGADDLKTFAFDPAAPKSIAVSAIQLNPY